MAFKMLTIINTPTPSRQCIAPLGMNRAALKPTELEGGVTSWSIAIAVKKFMQKITYFPLKRYGLPLYRFSNLHDYPHR